jgi:hypothetical protein
MLHTVLMSLKQFQVLFQIGMRTLPRDMTASPATPYRTIAVGQQDYIQAASF